MVKTPPPPAAASKKPLVAPQVLSHYAKVLSYALTAGVFISVSAHAILLALNFTPPNMMLKRQQDRGLEIVLVNARHTKAPKEAQVLAQANLTGGGNTDEKVLATSPLPPEKHLQDGDDLVETHKRVQQLENKQEQLLTRSRSASSINLQQAPAANDPALDPSNDTPGIDLVENARAIARQEAIVDKRLSDYAKRPRQKIITTQAQEYRFAQYAEDWRAKVERIGTLHYPASARGKLSGSLVLSVEIRADGSVSKVEINRSSGHKLLDEAALRIIQLASPFARFPEDIRKDTDILIITRTWTFTSSDQLKTE